VLRKSDNLAGETRLAVREDCLQIFEVFQPGGGFDIAVAAGYR
jgi:hypothetical protein